MDATHQADADPRPADPAPTPAGAPSNGPAEGSPAPAADGSASTPPPSWLDRLPGWTVPAFLLGVPLLAWLVSLAAPAFFDHVLWQYYWGPIKADAENVRSLTHNGIVAHSGYNVVNTLSWAVLLGSCILGLAQMLRRFKAPMDAPLIVAATAWVVVGSVAHVLEDTGLFSTPLQYFFITPPIYLLFGAFGVLSFLVAQWLKGIAERKGLHAALRMLWLVHVVLVLLWLAFWLKPWDQILVYVNPLWVAGFAVVSFAVARHFILKVGRIDPAQLTLTLSLGTYLLVGAYVVSFVNDPWARQADNAMPWSSVLAPLMAGTAVLVVRQMPRKALLGLVLVGGSILAGVAAVLILQRIGDRLGIAALQSVTGLLAVVVALGVAGLVGARWWKGLRPQLPAALTAMGPAFRQPINLLIVFAQMVDAFATSLGIDAAGYEEKHVLSAYIIDAFRDFSIGVGFDFGARYPTFLAFASVKLIVSLLVIYAVDVHSRNDEQQPTVIGLVKFAIIMVGLGPGVRDFVRLSLGV